MKSSDLLEQCENLTRRKLDYWCQQGLFDHDVQRRRRDFSDEDLRVARVISRVASAFDVWSGGRGGPLGLYRKVADQVRAGQTFICVPLGGGVEVTVTLDSPGEPVLDEPVPHEDAGFVPGVGVDNA